MSPRPHGFYTLWCFWVIKSTFFFFTPRKCVTRGEMRWGEGDFLVIAGLFLEKTWLCCFFVRVMWLHSCVRGAPIKSDNWILQIHKGLIRTERWADVWGSLVCSNFHFCLFWGRDSAISVEIWNPYLQPHQRIRQQREQWWNLRNGKVSGSLNWVILHKLNMNHNNIIRESIFSFSKQVKKSRRGAWNMAIEWKTLKYLQEEAKENR